MPIQPDLKSKKDIEERYSNTEAFEFLEPNKLMNMEDFYDYMFSVSKQLTEVEQKLTDILYHSIEALTINKIRNIFTEAYLIRIFKIIISDLPERHFKDMEMKRFCKLFLKERKDYSFIEYPTELLYTPAKLIAFFEDYFPFFKDLIPSKKNLLKEFINRRNIKRTLAETESKHMERARSLLSKYGYSVPSGEAIKSSLEFLKEKKIVNFRIQNNNYIWFLEPKFAMLMKKIERYEEKKEKVEEEISIQKVDNNGVEDNTTIYSIEDKSSNSTHKSKEKGKIHSTKSK